LIDRRAVTDIADAMILSLLFSTLFSMGVVLVATSNRPPNELYEDGLNRSYFLPFIDVLKRHCMIHDMGSTLDYRMLNAASEYSESRLFPSFYLAGEADRHLDDVVLMLRAGQPESPLQLPVPYSSRHVYVPSADESYRVGRFQFADLCDRALGASDFRAVAAAFDCVAIDSIPILSKRRHNSARRFITLIDELYEARTPLLCSAEAVPASQLFQSETDVPLQGEEDPSAALASVRELSFAFQRAASRLEEMTSRAWWNRHFPDSDMFQTGAPDSRQI
jgi:cell division protein ZapE